MTSASLDGKIVVIPGGTGNVGEGIVRAFLTAGATVIVSSRNQARLDELAKLIGSGHVGNLKTITAGYGTFTEADQLATGITREYGHVDHVVATVGGWWMGKALWQISEDDGQKVFVDVATTHMALARSFVPRLAEGGTYTAIAGFSAQSPYPTAGIVSMQGAAQLMMREALSANSAASGASTTSSSARSSTGAVRAVIPTGSPPTRSARRRSASPSLHRSPMSTSSWTRVTT